MPPGKSNGNGNGNGNGNNTTAAAAATDDTHETTIAVNGFSVLGNAAKSNAPAANGGLLRIHSGTDVFESDDIIVLTIQNTTADGMLTDDSVITRIEVYENAFDYTFGEPKFTYDGTADIDVGRRTMGDRYLEFQADGLTSDEDGAPALEELTIVAGVNIRQALDADGRIDVPTIEDIDTDGDGTATPGDGIFSAELEELLVVCFAAGTLIETPDGPRYIETLTEGDLVNTLDDGPQPVRWIGKQRMPGTGPNAPVHIRAGALRNLRDLKVSQNHRMLVTGAEAELLFGTGEVLVAAKHLVNGTTIRVVPCEEVEYVHFLFDAHQIVFAEGCPSESLYPGPQTLGIVDEEARDEIIAFFPELQDAQFRAPMSRYALRRFEAMALRAIA
ncbi:Hint domain-containing protein [Roseobacter ponti]|uniref:Hint domain-containing protein n=1 Tax=Roseobacter ponti TaxID=1891787 RepID=A0A858SWJ3_9RHOB|nr:Hint domain-containing protein [Roseobacter ponti]QJF52013.1 Hint domain-containing protein [Roseobacter ponti]